MRKPTRQFMRKKLRLFAMVFAVMLLSVSAHAQVFHDVPLVGDYPISEVFAFGVTSTCSGHTSIHQATAREDGWFAVCSLCSDASEQESDLFSLHYVDIYDQNGDFQMELTYRTGLDNAIELTDSSLDIYFQTAIISYDFKTGSLTGYQIPPRATVENGLLLKLQKNRFTVGEWTYSLSGGWMEHFRLSRTNGETTQVLIAYNPSSRILYRPEFWACTGVTAAFVAVLLIFLRRKRSG